jgi:hypothetical protein
VILPPLVFPLRNFFVVYVLMNKDNGTVWF